MKVMTVVGTRPEIIRLSRVIAALDEVFDHVLVHTGQNYDYELSEIFFDDLGIRPPDHYLGVAGGTASETIGRVIISVDAVLSEEKPDALLILGDTNSALAALPAKRRRVPVFHMEAGNRCFDERVPEEINRRIVDHIADINLPYSDISREYLLAEGLPADRIIKTGSPMREVLAYHESAISQATVLADMGLRPFEYFLVSAHREENVDDPGQFAAFMDLLQQLSSSHSLPVVLTTHPRTRHRIDESGLVLPAEVIVCKPFGFTDYVSLQLNAKAVLSDSGTITEEASVLNLRALSIREAHERPEGMEEAAVMLTGMNWPVVEQALLILARQPRGPDRSLGLVSDYAASNVSEKVVRLILSYTHYVNSVVWRR